MGTLQQCLFELEQQRKPKQGSSSLRKICLRVFYGWSKINKIRKREAISVIFENGSQPEERVERFISRMQDTCYVRMQTEGEMADASSICRMFTEYSVYLDDKRIRGSLQEALLVNNTADSRNVSVAIRKEIQEALRKGYMQCHPDYHEPVRQLSLFNEV